MKILGGKHPDTLSSMANLCELLSMQDDMAGAYAIGKRVVRSYASVLGDRHPDSITAMQNLAHILARLGKADELRLLQDRISQAREHSKAKVSDVTTWSDSPSRDVAP
jgi:hypothetical protein